MVVWGVTKPDHIPFTLGHVAVAIARLCAGVLYVTPAAFIFFPDEALFMWIGEKLGALLVLLATVLRSVQ